MNKIEYLKEDIYNTLEAYGGSAVRSVICEELYNSPVKYRTNVYEALMKMKKAGIVDRRPVKSQYRRRGRPEIEWYIIEGGLDGQD